jgi:hypothetical protein
MARKPKNNVDYFPFLCKDGETLFYLEETYGNDGFAVFIKLLRQLALTDFHHLDLSKKSTRMFLSSKCKVPVNVLEAIILDLAELGKFDLELWNKYSIIWCQDFIDNIQDAYLKRTNDCIDKKGLLLLLSSKGIHKPVKSTRKHDLLPLEGDGNPHTIVEDTIPKNTIPDNTIEKKGTKRFVHPSNEDLEKFFKDKGLNDFKSKEKAQAFLNFYISNGWKVGKNPMKSWQGAAGGQWMKSESNYTPQSKTSNNPLHLGKQNYTTR